MPLDGFTLHFLTEELRRDIVGCRVEKVHQPSKDELVMHLRDRNGAKKLFLSASANSPRVHLTSRAPENPAVPPMFCMLMRKHLTSAQITDVRQNGLDRVLAIDFSATNELGDKVARTLYAEIMAKHSNLILVSESGRIVDAVKRIDCTQSSVRQLLPGGEYRDPPAQNKLRLLEEPAEKTNIGKPTILKNEYGKPIEFSFEEIHQYGTAYTPESYDSFSQLLDEFYSERDRIDRTRQRSSDLQKLLSNATSRISRRLNNQRAELAACADKDELRINAELITAYQHALGKGVPFYEVADYYNENKPRRINADPALSPSANALKYYKEYRKAKTAEQMLATLIEQGEAELQYIDTVSDALSRASGFGEINEIRAELAASGYIKRKSVQNKKGLQKPSAPMEYRSTDGFKILVGRNNVQNDKLSLKTAAKGDMWLHTQKIPGSHVIICAEGMEIPDSTLEEAARLAAYHSRARESSNVPVDYTRVKNLKKPVGAKPGKVIYHVYNTAFVTPDSAEAEKLAVKV